MYAQTHIITQFKRNNVDYSGERANVDTQFGITTWLTTYVC